MCLFPRNITYIGGESIATGYITVRVFDELNQPKGIAKLRIYQTEHDQMVFQQQHFTDERGVSHPISLAAPESTLSYDKWQMEKPYACYDMEVTMEGYDTEVFLGVQIFAEQYSTLAVQMNTSKTKEPQRNTIQIEAHSLFMPGDQDA